MDWSANEIEFLSSQTVISYPKSRKFSSFHLHFDFWRSQFFGISRSLTVDPLLLASKSLSRHLFPSAQKLRGKSRLIFNTTGQHFNFLRGFVKMASEKPFVMFVLGGPGAGKGTQCQKIVKEFDYAHLSAGDLLRAEQASGSKNGTMIAEMIKNGQIVPSEVTVRLLLKAMSDSPKSKFLIDGFPRNEENNSSWIKETQGKVDFGCVLAFNCPEDTMQKRLLKRGESSGRSDDNIESILKRFKTYKEQTQPVIAYYKAKDQVIEINADQTEEKVWADVKSHIHSKFSV